MHARLSASTLPELTTIASVLPLDLPRPATGCIHIEELAEAVFVCDELRRVDFAWKRDVSIEPDDRQSTQRLTIHPRNVSSALSVWTLLYYHPTRSGKYPNPGRE